MIQSAVPFLLLVSLVSAEMVNTLSAGMSMPVGYEFANINPGLSLGIDVNAKAHKNFGAGAHLDYAWLPAKNRFHWDYFKIGIHAFDLAAVFRGYGEIDSQNELFVEIDPGFTVTWLYYDYIDNDGYGDKGSNYRNDFGMTCGIGVANNLMRIMLKWKTIFDVERASKSSVYIWAASFMILTIGVPIAG
jgi:hypothetical protein